MDKIELTTLKKDASSFFWQMEKLHGSARLQHTASMMELPAEIADLIDEIDDDDLVDDDQYEYYFDDNKNNNNNDNNNNGNNTNNNNNDNDQKIDKKHYRNYDHPQITATTSGPDAAAAAPAAAVTPQRHRSDANIITPFTIQFTTKNSVVMHPNDDDNDTNDDDDDDDDDDGYWTASSGSQHSNTMSLNNDLWNNNLDISLFSECNIRFEEDLWLNSGRPPALEFQSLKFFYQFVYDKFHYESQFLLDTSLPIYSEWKKMRRVSVRKKALKTVDHALKSCIACVDLMKCFVRNCRILNIDSTQNSSYLFPSYSDPYPSILSYKFKVSLYSIISAWDLFDNGSTPSSSDWNKALNDINISGIPQKLSSFLPDVSLYAGSDNSDNKLKALAYHVCKQYKFNLICEYLTLKPDVLQFNNNNSSQILNNNCSSFKWKDIKLHYNKNKKINSSLLRAKAFDQIYYINPSISTLPLLMNDIKDKSSVFISKRRIIAEPIMWLIYIVSFLLERQEKLQNLFMKSMSFNDDNNKNKGQKLNTLISNLAKKAKDESDRLRSIMSKLPQLDDLKKTLKQLVNSRDPQCKTEYAKSLKNYKF